MKIFRTLTIALLGISGMSQAASLSAGDIRAVRVAVEKSLALMQPSSKQFFQKSGCISCHHQSIGALAVAAARERGFTVDEELARYQVKATISIAAPHREALLQAIPTIPVTPIVSSYALAGLAAERYPADETTDALVMELAARQASDGSWRTDEQRPPLEQSRFTSTTLTARALQLYAPAGRKQEFDKRVAKAREWLANAQAHTTQEMTMRLLGLAWTRADRTQLKAAATALLSGQRSDGGWAQLPGLESDAYATGQVLFALHEAGTLKGTDPQYRTGVQFLLRTQRPDGSWHVKSRAMGFQPYFESGYPHGHDQWISSAGAAWATLALATAVEPPRTLSRR